MSGTAKRFAMFLSGLAGVMAFNVIVGVFGLIPAGIGLLAQRDPTASAALLEALTPFFETIGDLGRWS